ncbi:hypothetical protein WR25_15290 [Diploscapter pachys]|uniref:Uncharacterized protein n=1 Tax=Diploscapter pachys TaxID=2018661 RepID=A0A2A2KG11_9BILA|nr:hypothetical protein WR25_15290 [Diploscapter pachys]
MSSNGDVSRSPFLSLFHRKKKVNGTKSADDLKLLANGQKLAAAANLPQVDPKMTRTDSKKKDKKANTLPSSDRKKSKKSQKGFNDYTKSQSMDVLYEEDPSILVEALQAIADEQPIVARTPDKSIRKGQCCCSEVGVEKVMKLAKKHR